MPYLQATGHRQRYGIRIIRSPQDGNISQMFVVTFLLLFYNSWASRYEASDQMLPPVTHM